MYLLKLLALSLSLTLTSMTAYGIDKVIYGEDGRKDLYEVDDYNKLEAARSVAGMFKSNALSRHGNNYSIRSHRLSDNRICSSERFAKQPAGSLCTGFLVGEDTLVTAGHCIKNLNDCRAHKWVFDYAYIDGVQKFKNIPKANVFNCKRIIATNLDNRSMLDYAVIKLDRPVRGRRPLEFRKHGRVRRSDEIYVIGTPSGLPLKVADSAFVRDTSNRVYFTANLDTFGGNSGSPVFNENTGEVEGILVRGDNDYVKTSTGCKKVNHCRMNGCRGESVTRISQVREIF